MKPTKIIATVVGGVAAVDLALGRSGNNPLPDFIANQLTQEIDLILIAVAIFLWTR